MMPGLDKIVVVTRKTALEELIERFNTRDQARFYIEHMGGSFDWYESAHKAYRDSVEALRKAVPREVRSQWIERSFLPTFTFGANDLIVTLGQDGLVVNTAKYLNRQPLLAFNPDPERVDGLLSAFPVSDARGEIESALARQSPIRSVTMAEATLNDGRSLLAVNDLFLGQKTHLSARYLLTQGDLEEAQSSSGIIVSTGAGSTGWYRSILTGAAGVMAAVLEDRSIESGKDEYYFDLESEFLVFSVREPFISRTSTAEIVHGEITRDAPLVVTSQMPRNGVIFSDGVEEDYLPFNSGSIATVGISDRKLMLISRARR
jgi:NAD kinase